jgi:hypothetical protein
VHVDLFEAQYRGVGIVARSMMFEPVGRPHAAVITRSE